MNTALRRVAGGRAVNLPLISSLSRKKTYATAAVISEERVRRALERGQAKVASTSVIQ